MDQLSVLNAVCRVVDRLLSAKVHARVDFSAKTRRRPHWS
jgi:hypothetical protein